MIHYYTTRSFKRFGSREPETYRLLCTKEWATVAMGEDGYPKLRRNMEYVTVPHNVTCPKCLRLLIPKKERELSTMKRNLEEGDRRERENNPGGSATIARDSAGDSSSIPDLATGRRGPEPVP